MVDQKISLKRLQKKIRQFTGNSKLRIYGKNTYYNLSLPYYSIGNGKFTEKGESVFEKFTDFEENELQFQTLSELQKWFNWLLPSEPLFQRLCFFGKVKPIEADFVLLRVCTPLQEECLGETFELKRYIESVDSVYLVNRKSHTFCCELTPSYAMHFLYCESTLVKELEAELTEKQREEISEYDFEYERAEEAVTYMHVSGIDRSIERGSIKLLQIKPEKYAECETEEQAIEELTEYYIGNRYL